MKLIKEVGMAGAIFFFRPFVTFTVSEKEAE